MVAIATCCTLLLALSLLPLPLAASISFSLIADMGSPRRRLIRAAADSDQPLPVAAVRLGRQTRQPCASAENANQHKRVDGSRQNKIPEASSATLGQFHHQAVHDDSSAHKPRNAGQP